MKVRGDFKILGDLYVNKNTPENKLLYVGIDGKITYDTFKVEVVSSTGFYPLNSFVTNIDSSRVYLARVVNAPGDQLGDTNSWLDITTGGTGGGGETENPVTPSIDLGGVEKGITIPAGTDLEEFIIELVRPKVDASLSSGVSFSSNINIPNPSPVGARISVYYTSVYKTGKVNGYDVNKVDTIFDLKGSGTISYTPSNLSNVIITEDNTFNSSVSYDEGTGIIYNSDGSINNSFDRTMGSKSIDISVKGYYPVYVGASNLDPAQVITELINGNIPGNFKNIDYTFFQKVREPHDIQNSLKYMYVVIPKDKYDKFEVISQTFENIIDSNLTPDAFNLQLGFSVNTTPYYIFSRNINRYSKDMPVNIKINNI